MKLHILTIETKATDSIEAFITPEALRTRMREIINVALTGDIDDDIAKEIRDNLENDDLEAAWDKFLENGIALTDRYRTQEVEVPGVFALPENETFADAIVDLVERGNQHPEIRDGVIYYHKALKG